MVMKRLSARAASRPRRVKRRKPRLRLMAPNTARRCVAAFCRGLHPQSCVAGVPSPRPVWSPVAAARWPVLGHVAVGQVCRLGGGDQPARSPVAVDGDVAAVGVVPVAGVEQERADGFAHFGVIEVVSGGLGHWFTPQRVVDVLGNIGSDHHPVFGHRRLGVVALHPATALSWHHAAVEIGDVDLVGVLDAVIIACRGRRRGGGLRFGQSDAGSGDTTTAGGRRRTTRSPTLRLASCLVVGLAASEPLQLEIEPSLCFLDWIKHLRDTATAVSLLGRDVDAADRRYAPDRFRPGGPGGAAPTQRQPHATGLPVCADHQDRQRARLRDGHRTHRPRQRRPARPRPTST